MKMKRANRSGFTLAEVAVTIVIVGIAVVMMLQSLNRAKLESAHTRNLKLARELALMTLGRVESGLFRDDISRGLSGSFADEGYPMFSYEVAVGDDQFVDRTATNDRFDTWQARRDREAEKRDRSKEEERAREPYERVKVKVTWELKIQDLPTELVLERWMTGDQVYGPPDATKAAGGAR
jgi:prepilin-type N-terminal cleavage/methylation domain-containing protein